MSNIIGMIIKKQKKWRIWRKKERKKERKKNIGKVYVWIVDWVNDGNAKHMHSASLDTDLVANRMGNGERSPLSTVETLYA